MSNPALDEISYKLGEVSAGLATLASKFEQQDQKLEKQGQQLTDLGSSMGEIKTRIKPITDDIRWMKPQVRSYQRVRWLGGIVVACLGVVGGSLGDWFIKKITGA